MYMNLKIKHLEMIEAVAERMAKNSFTIKGWTMGLVSIVGVLASQNSDYNTAISYYEQALSTDIYNVKLTFKLILAHFNSGDQEKAVNMIGQLDETTLQIDNVEDISEENRKELEQTKEIIDKLKKILKEGLNEDL